MNPFPRAEICLTSLSNNVLQLRKIAPDSKLLAVVKANAYGHGVIEVAKHLDPQVDGFGLARLSEALAMRAAGIQSKLVLLEGFFSAEDLPLLVEHGIETVVHHVSQLQMLASVQLEKPVKVWLKIDTGMHRLGFVPEQFASVYQQLLASDNVDPDILLMTHFSRADEPEQSTTLEQLACFDQLVAQVKGAHSVANSAGTLLWASARRQWNRPGIALYGVSPVADDLGSHHGLRAAMTLSSNLIAVREHQAGQPVGYGGHWIAPKATKLGVVAIGYGDGYPRNAPEGTPVWLNGRRVPIVGRVSMDMLTVDLGEDALDQVGDQVELWGQNLPIEQVASAIGTIAYELMTKLTPRVVVNLK